jgi:hypothetical protein
LAPEEVWRLIFSEYEAIAAGRGFLKLSVIDANGRADRVTVRLK